MIYELACYLALAVSGWLLLGALLGPRAGQGERPLIVFGLIGIAWTAGELMLLHGDSSETLVIARRLLYLGSAGLPPAWFWVASRTACPRWYRERPQLVALAFVVPVFFYSCLYWDRAGRFTTWDSPSAMHGPWFDLFATHQYFVSAVGTLLFVAAARRLARSTLPVIGALAIGFLIPLVANLLRFAELTELDWTVPSLAPAGILIWLALIDSGLSSRLPLDRHEVIEQLDVGVVIADLDGRIVSVNAAARRLADQGDLLGRLLPEAVAAAEQRPDTVIESRGIALRGRLGIVGHALILSDRTQAEASRRRLELGGRLEALGSLTAGIAHEVNNPLSYIQANLSSLATVAKELSEPDVRATLGDSLGESVGDMSAILEETQEGVERIRSLVERLRNFSRTPDLNASALEVDLDTSARQAAAVARIGRPGDPFRFQGQSGLRIVTIETAVFQILTNLFLNAIQACPEPAEIVVDSCIDGAGVRIRVTDNGPGIAEALLPRVFDPFFTTKPTGTGLGLSLSYDLAQQIGGHLQASNAEGGGALFELWLPNVLPERYAAEVEESSLDDVS